jgi:aspartate-semialdehyde dehydrogenase
MWTFENEFDLEELKTLLSNAPGIVLQQNDAEQFYPMPLWAHEKDEVFVGRLRRDEHNPKH